MRLQKPMLYNQTLKGNSLKCILISVYEWYGREGRTKNKYIEADLISWSNLYTTILYFVIFHTNIFSTVDYSCVYKGYDMIFGINMPIKRTWK